MDFFGFELMGVFAEEASSQRFKWVLGGHGAGSSDGEEDGHYPMEFDAVECPDVTGAKDVSSAQVPGIEGSGLL
jgi:hypothetical protein